MKIIIELDDALLKEDKVVIIKEKRGLYQRGTVDLCAFADILNEIFQWEASGRSVKVITRDDRQFYAFGMNGTNWRAVLDLAPDTYYLIAESGRAYCCRLPRIVADVGSHQYPRLFWTKARKLTPESVIYPLMLGNVDSRGRVCLGNTGLVCRRPEDAAKFVRQVIEAPSTGHILPWTRTQALTLDELFAQLEQGWDDGIGRPYGITVKALLEQADNVA